jgi:hypothetical protein
MGSNTSCAVPPLQLDAALPILAKGDAYWAQREAAPREADVAMDWPEDLLLPFSLRMAVHGMNISRVSMLSDGRYALQQLMFAQSLQDTRLQNLAAKLMLHFEARQNGRPSLH